MSTSGIAQLDEMIARIRRLGAPTLVDEVAREAAPLVDAAIKRTARAGVTPLGAPWKSKKDGGAPLVNAAAAITTRALGRIVAVTLTGPTVFHHLGLGGKPRRQVIPDGVSIPPGVKEAAIEAARRVFRRITRGAA